LCGWNVLYSSRHTSIFSFVSSSDKNQCVLRHSSRKLPLKDSIYGLSVGFPGLEKTSSTSSPVCPLIHILGDELRAVASLMPIFRHTISTFVPVSLCLIAKAI